MFTTLAENMYLINDAHAGWLFSERRKAQVGKQVMQQLSLGSSQAVLEHLFRTQFLSTSSGSFGSQPALDICFTWTDTLTERCYS
jgi:hypothetical protein